MSGILQGLRQFSFTSALIRLALAMACGGAVGYGRSKKARAAGLRTYMLISIGAAMAVLLTLYQYRMLTGPWADVVDEVGLKFDVARMASQVITGIGFLGAGIIIKVAHQQVKGLTTAAGLWTTGIIGLSIGCGYYELGLVGTALVLLAETWFARLGSGIQSAPEYAVELLYDEKTSLDHVLRFCKDNRMAIVNLRIHTMEDQSEAKYTAEVSLRGGMKQEALLDKVQQMPGIVTAVGL